MTPSDVDLIKMTDSAVSRRNGDVFELDVHIIFGCPERSSLATAPRSRRIGWGVGYGSVKV